RANPVGPLAAMALPQDVQHRLSLVPVERWPSLDDLVPDQDPQSFLSNGVQSPAERLGLLLAGHAAKVKGDGRALPFHLDARNIDRREAVRRTCHRRPVFVDLRMTVTDAGSFDLVTMVTHEGDSIHAHPIAY